MQKPKGAVFEPIELAWDGVEYHVPAHKVMGAIHKIENIITLAELAACAEKEAAPLGKISSAYAAVLRYAGADLADEDVYAGMFAGNHSQEIVINALHGIISMMLPLSARKKADQALAEGRKIVDEGKKDKAPSNSSKRRSRRRRGKSG